MNSDDRLLNLRYWKEMVSRQRWLILACIVSVTGAALVLSVLRTPIYEATCSLYLNRQKVQPMNFQDIYTKQQYNRPNDLVLTQVEILRSTPILEQAVRDLESRGLLKFVDSTVPPKPSLKLRFLQLLGTPLPKLPMKSEEKRTAFVTELQKEITVGTSGGLAFISIAVPYDDPDTAAALANAIASAYLKNDRELLHRSADEAMQWLSEKMRDQQVKLLEAEERLRTFAGPAPHVEDMNQLAVQEMTRLSQALLDVRLKVLQAESGGVVGGGSAAGTQPKPDAQESLDLEVNKALRDKTQRDLVDVTSSLSVLRQTYGESHPDVINMAEKEKQLRAELTRLDALIPRPPILIDASGRVDPSALKGLKAQEKLLRDTMDQSAQSNANKGDSALRYAMLKREVEINRSLYNEMMSRFNEITISAGLDSATAEVFEPARPPALPISPNHPKALMLGFVAGILLALSAAGLRDHLDQTLRDPGHANDLLRAPVLGLIPHHGKSILRGKETRALQVGAGEESQFAEAYRVLRSHIEGAVAPEDSAILLMTSAVPGEGKSTTAANLAAAFAESGRHVLLVDADFRRPALGRFFKLNGKSCVSRVLRGENGPETQVTPSGVENLDLIGYQLGGEIPDPRKTTEGFRSLFDWARQHYDRVIVDLPIIMVAPGVTEVGRAGGSVLLVHRPGWVPAPVLEQIRDHLTLARTRLVGVVLNGIQQRWSAGHYLPAYYGASYESTTKPVPKKTGRAG
jgi:capsular exopolysaccharide synthesis family protein